MDSHPHTVRRADGRTNGSKVLRGAVAGTHRSCRRYRAPMIEFDDFLKLDMRVGRIAALNMYPIYHGLERVGDGALPPTG